MTYKEWPYRRQMFRFTILLLHKDICMISIGNMLGCLGNHVWARQVDVVWADWWIFSSPDKCFVWFYIMWMWVYIYIITCSVNILICRRRTFLLFWLFSNLYLLIHWKTASAISFCHYSISLFYIFLSYCYKELEWKVKIKIELKKIVFIDNSFVNKLDLFLLHHYFLMMKISLHSP